MALTNPLGGSNISSIMDEQCHYIARGRNPDDRSTQFPGTMSVANPATDSDSGYPKNSLPFITNVVAPTAQAACETSFAPDYGTQVLVRQEMGMPTSKMVVGLVPSKLALQGIPGNFNPHKGLMEAIRTKLQKIKQKPSLRNKMDKGALVKEAVEKDYFSLQLLKGLPSHGALPAMTGHMHEQIKNIETAVQQFFSIPGLGFDISGLGGSNMSLSNLRSKMTKEQRKKLEDSVDPDMLDAIYSLMRFISINAADGFTNDGLVDEETFIDNVVNRLSKAKNQEHLMEIVTDLMTSPGLRGLSKISRINTEVETPYGNLRVFMTSTGDVSLSSNSANTLAEAKSSLTSTMKSVTTSTGQNLFGEAASVMSDMFSRIPNNMRQQLVQSVSQQFKQKGHESTNLKANKGTQYPW